MSTADFGPEYNPSAQEVLAANLVHDRITTASRTYANFWPDMGAIAAAGVATFDAEQGAASLEYAVTAGQLLSGQISHMVFAEPTWRVPKEVMNERLLWGKVPGAPRGTRVSGVSAPMVFAAKTLEVAEHLEPGKRVPFLKKIQPFLEAQHNWAHRNRRFGNSLAFSAHPYELGTNTVPYYVDHIRRQSPDLLQSILGKLPVERLVHGYRADKVGEDNRISINAPAGLTVVLTGRKFAKLGYDAQRIKAEWPYKLFDVAFNSRLVHSDAQLRRIADETGVKLRAGLPERMASLAEAFSSLYVPATEPDQPGHYFSQTMEGEPLPVLTINSLLPILNQDLPSDHVREIVGLLRDPAAFGTPYPIPTAPVSYEHYDPSKENEGGVKPVFNFEIAQGLLAHGERELARSILNSTRDAIASSPMVYSSQTGRALDQNRAAPTAATALEIGKLIGPTAMALVAYARNLYAKAA